jgi:hypothetical protein
VKAAVIIPITFSERNPKKYIATEPLTPISVKAIVGITDILKKVNALMVKDCKNVTSMFTNLISK